MNVKRLKNVTSVTKLAQTYRKKKKILPLTIEEGFALRERAFEVVEFCKTRNCFLYWWTCPKLCDDAKLFLTANPEVIKVLKDNPNKPRERKSVYAGKRIDNIIGYGGYADSGFDSDYYSDSEIDTETLEQKDEQRFQSETRSQEENDEWWKAKFATGPALSIGDIVQLVENLKLSNKEWAAIMRCEDLSIRQLQILYDRYWTQNTMIQIANELNISRERARIILKKALSILLPQLWILHEKRQKKKRLQVGKNGYDPKIIHRYRPTYKTKEK